MATVRRQVGENGDASPKLLLLRNLWQNVPLGGKDLPLRAGPLLLPLGWGKSRIRVPGGHSYAPRRTPLPMVPGRLLPFPQPRPRPRNAFPKTGKRGHSGENGDIQGSFPMTREKKRGRARLLLTEIVCRCIL